MHAQELSRTQNQIDSVKQAGSPYVVVLVPTEEADLDAFEQTCSKHRRPRNQPSARDSFVEAVEVEKRAAVDWEEEKRLPYKVDPKFFLTLPVRFLLFLDFERR
jgi:hypothetical protein